MQVHISIGESRRFQLHEALLVYGDGQRNFVTRHSVATPEHAAPKLGPAEPLTHTFVESLLRDLRGHEEVEVLPEKVLAKGDGMIVWWTPPQSRQMFFQHAEGECAELNGRVFPQPPLVWRVHHGILHVRALRQNRRPDAKTRMAFAPFWNVSDDGQVCTGTMRRPDNATVAGTPDWERGFYESAFSHSHVGRLTRHPGGFAALWGGLAGKRKAFPRETLILLPETLAQFVRGEEA